MNENFDVTYKALFRKYYPSLIFYATRLVGKRRRKTWYRMSLWSYGDGKTA